MRLASVALFALALAAIACTPQEEDGSAECVAPGGCSAVLATLGTGEAQVELLPDGEGGVYAALLGRGTGAIHCGANDVCHGELWRVDREGNLLWRVRERKSVDRPLLLPGGVAYRTGAGRLEAVSADGERLWRLEAGDPQLAASAWGGDVFVVGGGEVRRLRADTGEVVWSAPFSVTLPARPVPAQFPDRVVVSGYSNSSAILVRSLSWFDGSTAWEATLPGLLSAPALVSRPPNALTDRGPTMLVSDRLSLRQHDGTEEWGYDALEGFRFVQPLPDGGWIALGPLVSSVTRFRRVGTVLWSTPSQAPVVWIAVARDGHALIGSQDGVVQKRNTDTGLVLWQYGGVDQVKAPAAPVFRADGTAVFYGANTGIDSDPHLTTVTAAGQGLERWDAGARISSIALSDDADVFVAVSDGRLYLRRGAEL